MKTGGTLNFLKRAGAIFMLVAVFASSCNKYADDFKQLNTKIDALSTSLGGVTTLLGDLATVKASVASVLAAVNAVPNPTAALPKLQSDLTAASANITTINTTLNTLVTTVNNTVASKADVTAAVTSIAQKVKDDLTLQLATTKTQLDAAVVALKADNASQTTAVAASIAANNVTLQALVKGDIVANNEAISTAIAANNAAMDVLVKADLAVTNAAVALNSTAITANGTAIAANGTAIAKAVTDITAAIAANNAVMDALVKADGAANVATITAAITAGTGAVTAAITANNAAMDVLVKADILTNTTAITAAIAANNAAINTLITANNAAITAAIVANNPAISAAVAADLLANNTAIAAAIVANNPAIGTLITGNNAAIISAMGTNNTAMAALIQAQIDAQTAVIKAGTADDVTATTIKGLQLLLNALTSNVASLTTTTNQILLNTNPIPVQFTGVTSNGTTLLVSSTALTLTFDVEPLNLEASLITVTGATKGVLTHTSGTLTYSLAISGITVANLGLVTVAVGNPSGYVVTNDGTAAASRTVAVKVAPPVVFSGLTADGVAGVLNTTNLTLTFDVDPTSLVAGNITITAPTGTVTVGALTGTGLTRNLVVTLASVADGATLTMTVAQPSGFNITPATKTVVAKVANTLVTFSNLSADGTSGSVTTTNLILTFSVDPGAALFTGSLITVTGATKGALTGTGTTRNLVISNILVSDGQNIMVTVANPAGYAISPTSKNVAVNAGATPIAFTGLTADGTSLIATTANLTLTFSSDPTTILASNISVTGATKGALTGTGLTRNLAISAITVLDGQTITVTTTNPAGFTIAPATKTVVVNKVPTGVAFTGLVANGTQGLSATNQFTLAFSATPTGLLVGNLSLGGGANAGTLGALAAASTSMTLGYTASTNSSETLTITDPTGISISPSFKTVVINKVLGKAIAGVTAPVTGATPVSVTSAGTGYGAGTVTWSPAVVGGVFQSTVIYTATITLTPATGYLFTNLAADFWTVVSATTTSPVSSGVVTAVFPVTL